MTSTGADVVLVNLMIAELPTDTALVVVVAPKSAFKTEETAKLRAFSERKGPLLLILDSAETTGLEDLLRDFQIEIDKGFIIEPQLHITRNQTALLVPVVNSRHPLLESLNNQWIVFRRPSPLRIATPSPPPAAPPKITTTATPLLRTTPQSWVETDRTVTQLQRGPNSPAGPFTVGMVVSDQSAPGAAKPAAPRLVVVSGRYVGDNAEVLAVPANLDFLMNAVNWLRGKEESLGITPKTHVALDLDGQPRSPPPPDPRAHRAGRALNADSRRRDLRRPSRLTTDRPIEALMNPTPFIGS